MRRIPRSSTASPVMFRVLGDGRELWKSAPLQKQGKSTPLSVDVRGVRELRLETSCGDQDGRCHATWFLPRLLGWAKADGNCINSTTFAAVSRSQCATTGNLPAPMAGMFFDQVRRAWSMLDFVPGGAETGHDHFFATFGKFGTIAGFHRDDSLADVATRAAELRSPARSQTQVYLSTFSVQLGPACLPKTPEMHRLPVKRTGKTTARSIG